MTQLNKPSAQPEGAGSQAPRSGETLADVQHLLFRYTDNLYRSHSLSEAYEAALDAICEGLGCARASILRFDAGGVMRFVAWRGLSAAYRKGVEGHSPWKPDDRDPEPICVEDIALSSESEEIKALVAGEGICGLAFIPLMLNERIAGKFMVYYDVPRLFTLDERELALTIGRQLGFAMERDQADGVARRLAGIVASSQDAIVSKGLDGTITSWNQAAERLFGYSVEEVIGQSGMMLFPPDRVDEEPQILARVAAGEQIDRYHTVRLCKDGRLVDVSLTISPVKDGEGRVIGTSKIARDITREREAADRQALLLSEMDHRIKNLFSLAASLVQLSARRAETPEDLARAVVARLTALSRAHSLTMTTGSPDRGTTAPTVHATIAAVLEPFSEGAAEDVSRISVEGDNVELPAAQVTPLALLLYELATNASKYGSLSVPSGRVAITAVKLEGGLGLTWRELGGPLVAPPATPGFGSRLLEAAGRQLGELVRHWDGGGLRAEIIVRNH